MSDLISRQAIIDMLQSQAYDDWNQGASTTWANAFSECAELIRSVPSAEPEIIRCKDCKYMTEHYDTDGNAPYWTCSEWDSGTDYDGFCHYAERREE